MEILGRTIFIDVDGVCHIRKGGTIEKTWTGNIPEHIRLFDPELYRYMWENELSIEFDEETQELELFG